MENRRPLVADIKRNSLDDGPGIRSIVFFKGCPLSCIWCHNPECISAGPELIYRAEQCIGCKSCAEVCPTGAITDAGPGSVVREKCDLCGECADECPSGALSIVGRYYEPAGLVTELLRDKTFYDNSGGGVTLSGGEPTLQMEYSAEVAKMLKEQGVRVCIESCGDFDWERFAERLLPYIDLVYVDMKLENEDLHRKFTKRDNRRIKENIERIVTLDSVESLVRIPLIPDVTATRENLEAIASWMKERGIDKIALLPYNPLWLPKARGLSKSLEYERETWMSKEEREEVKSIFSDFELERDI